MNAKYGRISAPVFFIYAIHFTMAVACCNFYSDVTRKSPCVKGSINITDPDEASAVFDSALYLCGVYHTIEWLRSCILLCVILLEESRLMKLWYYSSPVVIFGFVACIYAHVSFFGSEKGDACAKS